MIHIKRPSFLAIGLSLLLPVLSRGDISNIASVTYQDAANNSYGPTNSNTATVTVIQAPAIVLTKTASPTSAVSGTVVTFTMAYQNNGGNATNAIITDTVPTGSTLVANSISNGGTLSGATITWNLGAVAASASGSVSFQVRVN